MKTHKNATPDRKPNNLIKRAYKTSFENWRSEVGKEKRFEFVLHEGNKTGTIYLYFHRSRKLEGRSKALKAPKSDHFN
uniref:Uncharacterized protein n=1 Tax=Romanomermis culicivorax TaxID=13658 RepID=A0A915L137_ROMCU